MSKRDVATEIVKDIVEDITNRSGLVDLWEEIHETKRAAIVAKWEEIVRGHLTVDRSEFL